MAAGIATTTDLLRRNAAEYGDVACLLFDEEVITYADLDARSDAVAAFLAERGVKKGDVVAFMMGNGPQLFYVLLGAQKIGAAGAPISCWWQAPEVAFLINDCRPPVLVEATVSYRITGGGGGDWTVTIRDGQMTVSHGIADAPRVYIVAKDRDYHDIATGTLDAVTAVVNGKLTIEGDVGFMTELRQMMKPLE